MSGEYQRQGLAFFRAADNGAVVKLAAEARETCQAGVRRVESDHACFAAAAASSRQDKGSENQSKAEGSLHPAEVSGDQPGSEAFCFSVESLPSRLAQ